MLEPSDSNKILAEVRNRKDPAENFSGLRVYKNFLRNSSKRWRHFLNYHFHPVFNVQFPTLNFKDMFKNPFKGLGALSGIQTVFDKLLNS